MAEKIKQGVVGPYFPSPDGPKLYIIVPESGKKKENLSQGTPEYREESSTGNIYGNISLNSISIGNREPVNTFM